MNEIIYKINLNLKSEKIVHNKFYYSILGAILNVFKNDNSIYENIISLSPLNKSNNGDFFIRISIIGEKNFNKITNEILTEKKELSIDGYKFILSGIDFNFKIFDLTNLKFQDFNKVDLRFLSPTYTKQSKNNKEIQNLLPNPEVFLLSSVRKYSKYYGLNIDFVKLKEELKNKTYIVQFDIKTKIVKIKGGIKAGVIGNIIYRFDESFDIELKKILYLGLRFASFSGLGSGTKLGMGQVGVYFNNK